MPEAKHILSLNKHSVISDSSSAFPPNFKLILLLTSFLHPFAEVEEENRENENAERRMCNTQTRTAETFTIKNTQKDELVHLKQG